MKIVCNIIQVPRGQYLVIPYITILQYLEAKEENTIDVKSILGLMSLAIPSGENVVIEASGDQAEEAINDIASILSK